MREENEDQDLVKREDISYRKLLLSQMFVCQDYMTDCFQGQQKTMDVRQFMTATEALKTLLYPYLTDSLKKSSLNFEDTLWKRKIPAVVLFRMTQKRLEELVEIMDKNNLLLEQTKEMEIG